MNHEPSGAERWLIWTLRGIGGLEAVAFLAMVMPTSWMIAAHQGLGMGELVATPILQYLTRTISALYGCLGLLQILISFDLPRYRPVITFLGWTHVVLGPAVFYLDSWAGLPGHWTWLEGPPILLLGLLYLALARRIRG